MFSAVHIFALKPILDHMLTRAPQGIILDKAIEYIAELEKQVESTSKANAGLQLMIKDSVPSYLMLGLRR